ncbi:MAG TPA: hypothetical protein VFE92_19730, partial [Dermatophilaceae bacterium]|nr:hypothetical protein [Dermatophilaceae bacterium]
MLLLEQRQYVLGAEHSPLRQEHVVLVSQCSTATNGDQSGVTLLGEDRHESNLPDVRSSAFAVVLCRPSAVPIAEWPTAQVVTLAAPLTVTVQGWQSGRLVSHEDEVPMFDGHHLQA